jgi:large subunit ribosomal protein L19
MKNIMKPFLKKNIPDIQPGDTVKVYQKIKEAAKKGKSSKKDLKEKIQVFEGLVLARKHGKEIGATITVRKVVGGIGVEKIFPLHLPTIENIEVIKKSKTRRAKLYYLRKARGKRARLKRKEFTEVMPEIETPAPATSDATPEDKEKRGKTETPKEIREGKIAEKPPIEKDKQKTQ